MKAGRKTVNAPTQQAIVDEATVLPWSRPDHSNPTPLYFQIYQLYRQRILSGVLKRGDKLPSESAQEAEYGVSRITARRAMDELAKEGLVTRERGRGTIVSYAMTGAQVSSDFTGLIENLVAIGTTTDVQVLSFNYQTVSDAVSDTVPDHVIQTMQAERGDQIQVAERQRSRDGQPLSYIVTYIPEIVGRSFTMADLNEQPVLSLIEQAGHVIAEAEQSVTAISADKHIAGVLQVDTGSAVLKISRVVRDHNKAPLQYIEVYYRPDAYQLNMRLTRVDVDSETRLWTAQSAGAVE